MASTTAHPDLRPARLSLLLVAVPVSLAMSGFIPRIRHQQAAPQLIDFRILRNPHFLAVALMPVAQAIGFISMLTYLPVTLSAVRGLSAGGAGAAMLAMTVPILFLPALAVRAIARWRRATVMSVITRRSPRCSPATLSCSSPARARRSP